MNKYLVVILGLIVLVLAVVIAIQRPETQTDNGTLNVVASFYPLAEFARNVGGEDVEVTALVPAGVEPHDFEPTPNDVKRILQADVILYNGAGFDTWLADIVSQNATAGSVVDMSTVVALKGSTAEDVPNAVDDPHFWLDPIAAQEIVAAIARTFSKIDANHAARYDENAKAYTATLQLLHLRYASELARCRLQNVIVSHNAFGYIADRYGFTLYSISGLSPEAEPSAKTLAELSDLAEVLDIQYVLVETLVSPRIAESLAKEAGAQTLVLNPLEGLTAQEESQGDNYLSVMERNLSTLKIARDCE